MRRLVLSKTLNTRDLGGYPIIGGKTTAYGKFFRSDALLDISDCDKELLLENNIFTIIDLRNGEEVLRKPCALKNIKEFKYYHCEIHGVPKIQSSAEDIPAAYFKMADEQSLMRPIMKILSTAADGVIYHCSCGKDRTGVISALLLALAGVPQIDIFADYQISQVYLYPRAREFYKKNTDIPVSPKIEYMETFFFMFYDKYRSVEEYLLTIGLLNNEIIQLKQKLVG